MLKQLSQLDRLQNLLMDCQMHTSEEISKVLYRSGYGRYGARIDNLRHLRGFKIDTKLIKGSLYGYTMQPTTVWKKAKKIN